jgi:hypothetical protein
MTPFGGSGTWAPLDAGQSERAGEIDDAGPRAGQPPDLLSTSTAAIREFTASTTADVEGDGCSAERQDAQPRRRMSSLTARILSQ